MLNNLQNFHYLISLQQLNQFQNFKNNDQTTHPQSSF